MRVYNTVTLHGKPITPLAYKQSTREKSNILAMSWLNICSSNATMGKSIGTPMEPRCKQKFEYSSDRYEKSLYRKGKTLVMVTSVFLSLHSLIKHTNFLHLSRYLRTEVLERQIMKKKC